MPNSQCPMHNAQFTSTGIKHSGLGIGHWALGIGHWALGIDPPVKYGLIPTSFFERLALWSGKVPIPLLDALFGLIKTRSIMAGASLGIFEALRDGSRTSADISHELQLNADALELLLRTLVVCDYLVQQGDGFALSPLGRKTMLEG